MADGTAVSMYHESSVCGQYYDGDTNVCGRMFVDINGKKGPNVFGRDMFVFVLQDDGLHPRGCNQNGRTCASLERTCACDIILDGEMNY